MTKAEIASIKWIIKANDILFIWQTTSNMLTNFWQNMFYGFIFNSRQTKEIQLTSDEEKPFRGPLVRKWKQLGWNPGGVNSENNSQWSVDEVRAIVQYQGLMSSSYIQQDLNTVQLVVVKIYFALFSYAYIWIRVARPRLLFQPSWGTIHSPHTFERIAYLHLQTHTRQFSLTLC